MAKCDLCLLGLIILSSLLTGTSGVDETHVFVNSGENVRLPCNNALSDCTSTTWNDDRHSVANELFSLGIKKNDTERHERLERLSLGSDCSLNINNVTIQDYGSYTCRQFVKDKQQGTDARVFLHVLHVSPSPSSSETEISPGHSVSLSCYLYSVSCNILIHSEDIELLWVNQAGVDLQTDSRYQISAPGHCIRTLTTTLLNEDHNRELRCVVTHRNQLKTTDTVTYSAQDDSTTPVIPVHITDSQDPSTITTPEPTAADDSTTPVIPVHITDSQDPSTITTPEPTDPSEPEVSVTAGSLYRVIVMIVEIAVFAGPTVILLQIICARRAGRKDSQHPEGIEMSTI